MAGNNDYLIPFGIDSAPFKKGIAEIDAGTDAMTANVLDSTKAMQKGFNDAAGAGEKLGSTLSIDAEKAAALRETAKTLGKELGSALSGKNTGNDFEKKIQKFSDMLAKFSANANRPIKFNIDSAKLETFEKALAEGADELQVLNGVLEATKVALSELDPNSEEWQALNSQIQIAEGFLEGLGNASQGAATKHQSLKGELRQLKAAMAEMEQAGHGDSEEFLNMAVRAGQLEDQIGDVSARVRVLASDTKYLDAGVQAVTALTGAFTAGQGALALFGAENEEAQKVIQKVTGAMAVLQGIQAVATALNKDSALSILLFSTAQKSAAVSTTALAGAEVAETGAAVAATTATRAFTAALLSNPITAILVGLAALVAALIAFSSESDDAEVATKRLNDELERQNELLSLDEASVKRRTDVQIAAIKLVGAERLKDAKTDQERLKIQQETEGNVTAAQQKGREDRLKLLRASLFETQHLYDQEGSDKEKLAEQITKINEEIRDTEAEVTSEIYNMRAQGIKNQQEIDKKIADDAKKAIEEQKKAAEERKKILEQQIRFTEELEKARVEAITDAYDQERAQLTTNANQQIAKLEAEKSLSIKAEKTKQAAIKAIKAGLAKELGEVDLKEAQDTAAIQLKAQQLTIQNREEGIVKEIETIRLGYEEKKEEIREQFKNETALRDELIEQLNDAQIREQKKAQDKFTNETIAKEEERAVLEIETATKFLPDLPGIEEKKQVEILNVKIRFAEQARQALIDQGNAENSTVVLQATKAVQDLKKQLGAAIKAEKDAGGLNWFDMLGLGELTEDQRAAVQDASRQMLDSISQITGFIVDQYQRQIDKKQEAIDQIDESIDDLEDQLDKEQDLRERGLANNVEAIQAEIDEKKKAREEEVKQAEELQKKKQAIAKAQLIIDTAEQASNLITASAKIFRSLADIPFIGIPLAISTIALMTGAFITAKVKAFQLVNEQKQSFGGGGFIDGKPHSQGGRTYRATDGSGVVELEGGEYVTNKNSTAKYADLLEAINNDDINGMNEDLLREMLAGLGVHLSSEAPMQVLKVVRERDDYRQNALMSEHPGSDISQDVQAISSNVKYLADKERARVERWQDDQYFYSKEGNKTTRIKKPKP
jgi:hypothetical protein